MFKQTILLCTIFNYSVNKFNFSGKNAHVPSMLTFNSKFDDYWYSIIAMIIVVIIVTSLR